MGTDCVPRKKGSCSVSRFRVSTFLYGTFGASTFFRCCKSKKKFESQYLFVGRRILAKVMQIFEGRFPFQTKADMAYRVLATSKSSCFSSLCYFLPCSRLHANVQRVFGYKEVPLSNHKHFKCSQLVMTAIIVVLYDL